MKQTLFLLLSTLLCWNISYCQIANGPLVYELCDDNVESDGDISNDSVQFDLSVLDFQILGSQNQSDFTVSYYFTQTDADNNINPLPILYTNTFNSETIYGRVSENSSSNYDTTTITLIVNSLPNINLTGDLFICDTGSTTIINTNLSETDYSFEWYLNGAFLTSGTNDIIIDQAGNYELYVVNYASGCAVITSFLISEIDCTDSDSDGVIDSDEDLNSNGNLEDDNTDMDSLANYLDNDDDNDGILTIDEDYNNNGDPTDDDTDNSGIPDYLEANVALSNESFEKENIKLFPNPSNDLVTIKGLNQISNIFIFDVQGKKINLETIKQSFSELKFSVKNLENGIYFIKIINEFKETTMKLIVE